MKNTTKWGLLDLVCPHICRGCGELGAVLCERCKKYMLEGRVEICPICKKMVAETKENVGKEKSCADGAENYAKSEYCGGGSGENRGAGYAADMGSGCEERGRDEHGCDGCGRDEHGCEGRRRDEHGCDGRRCEECESELEKCWVVGWREGALARLVKDFKYKSVRAAGKILAELVDEVLPEDLGAGGLLGDAGEGLAEERRIKKVGEVVVVPLPTIGRHVRERGLDHTKIIAWRLAKLRGWRMEMVLARATDTVQVGAKVAERKSQAEKTYEVVKRVGVGRRYLLLDDVWTTGATMTAAARVLREAGAEEVYGVVIAVGRPEETEEGRDTREAGEMDGRG